ncbi:MAG: TolC family protein [Candidatus Omnitrophica bacterium]|nr:TolC family protein [Candidatus Omnitrophota bacterium]
MRKIIIFLGLFLFPCLAHAADRLTLKDCYQMALKRSETIGIQKELIKETEGLMLQSLSTALPKVAFAYSEKWQDVAGQRHGDQYAPEAKFTLTQPLFTGFKEFAAISASKHIGKQREAELRRAKELLFVDVSDAFYLYLSYQEDEEAVGDIQKALHDRVKDLKKRESIGKSRLAEVASAEAKLRKAEANLEGVRSQKEVVAGLLSFLIGRSVNRLVVEDLPAWKPSIEKLLKNVDKRPDVIAAQEALASYKNNMTSARSSFLPNISLGANAYTKRADTYEGNDWDATLTVNVPIFNGTTDIGTYRQAKAQKNQAVLRLDRVRRMAMMEIKSAYIKWQANTRRVKALEKAVEAFEKNYDLQLKDFRNNLVNSLDILTAIEDLQGSRRDFIAGRADFYRSYWSLKVATGETDHPALGGTSLPFMDNKK